MCWGILKDKITFALIGLLLAGITDFLDGYLARILGCTSDFGALLDPIADKVFVLSVFITLMLTHHIPGWFFSIVLLRDILILIGGWFYFYLKLEGSLAPSFISKINTFLLFILFPWVLLRWPYALYFISAITLTTVLSGEEYARRFVSICCKR